MKKCLFTLTLLIASSLGLVLAQYKYKPFRVDLGQGISFATSSDLGVGSSLGVEPKYTFADKFSIGLRWELNVLMSFEYLKVGDFIIYENEPTDFLFRMSYALTPTFDYHFTTGTFRPFVGAGLGWCSLTGLQEERISNDLKISSGNTLGFMLRAGFDVPHFRLALTFNRAGNDNINLNYNYFSIFASGYIGGGRKKQIYPDQAL